MAEYKIKDLEQLTGLKAHTIRMWEKRYGILKPARTETKIRVYNDEELNRLLSISILNEHGIKISHIVEMSTQSIHHKIKDLKSNDIENVFQQQLTLALLKLDEALFIETIDQLILQNGLELTFTNYLIPFLDKIGVLWIVQSITPAQEHFISNLIRQKIICELDALPRVESSENSVFLFLAEHEWHEISLLFYHFCLKKRGVKTFYFGQSLPYESLKSAILQYNPKALVCSWIAQVTPTFIEAYFQQLRTDFPQIPVYAGGAQIQQNSKLISKYLIEIKSIQDLEKINN